MANFVKIHAKRSHLKPLLLGPSQAPDSCLQWPLRGRATPRTSTTGGQGPRKRRSEPIPTPESALHHPGRMVSKDKPQWAGTPVGETGSGRAAPMGFLKPDKVILEKQLT